MEYINNSNTLEKSIYDVIIKITKGAIRDIGNITKFEKSISKLSENSKEIICSYGHVCMLLGESYDLLSSYINLDEIAYQYMIRIKKELEVNIYKLSPSLFFGCCDLGFGVYALYKTSGHYKKFLKSLNKIIIAEVENYLSICTKGLSNVQMLHYDVISGLSGIMAYLLLFKYDNEVKQCIEKILRYLIALSESKQMLEFEVPKWYISSNNQFLEREKIFYRKGNFNLGLSHGISGELAALTIALQEGIKVEGQANCIKKILEILKKFSFMDEKNNIYWPGRIKFEEYVGLEKIENYKSRASWCYGSPGIARSMYMAGKTVNDEESSSIAIKSLYGICNMSENEWKLDSPTFCHGYSGLLSVIQMMCLDTGNTIFNKGRKKVLDRVISFYEKDAMLGFYDVHEKDYININNELVKSNSIFLLTGAIGVILSLLSTIKPVKTGWTKHFLIN